MNPTIQNAMPSCTYMIRTSTLYLLIVLLLPISILAQLAQDDKVLTQGKITYQRKVYIRKNLEDMDMNQQDWYDRFKDRIPVSIQTNFDLYFNPTSSYFSESAEQDGSGDNLLQWFQNYNQKNQVYADLESRRLVIHKTSMGKDFLIEDSIPPLQWKITDDFMTIAGFACRKATSIVMDSLYIIAFYTDAIYPSTGPEHFYGLPGTVLGVAIPRMHTSYMATEVESRTVTEQDIQIPKKGKKTNLIEMEKNLYDIGENFNQGNGARMSWGIWL